MRKIRFFRQHTMQTCGVSCMLMILDAFGKDIPTVGKEMQDYRKYCSRVVDPATGRKVPGTSCASIARGLVWRGLDVRLLHSSAQMMDNNGEYYPPALHAALLEEYRSNIERTEGAVSVEKGIPVTPDRLKDELNEGRLLMVQIIVPGDADGVHDMVLHGILVYGYENGTFSVCDPFKGKRGISEEELDELMNTPEGRIVLSAGQK